MMSRNWGRLFGTRNHHHRYPFSWKTFLEEEPAEKVGGTPENLQSLLNTMADLGLIRIDGQCIRLLPLNDNNPKVDL